MATLNIYAKNIPQWGWVWVEETAKGISKIGLGNPPRFIKQNGTSKKAFKKIEKFLSGKLEKLPLKITLQAGTPFQRNVWKTLQTIPYGETKSYQWVAKKIGKPKALRAVGQACGANPIPLFIPCHRVIASNGKIGGFSGGLHWKRRLLRLEGNTLE